MNNENQVKSDNRRTVNDVTLSVLPVSEGIVEQRQIDDLAKDLFRLNRGIFRLVVMGEIKKGKSSFINALLAEPDLLPTSAEVATSTVFKLIYGPEKKHKVFFLPDPDSGEVFPPTEVTRDELVHYGTEDGNPGNEKRVVDFIGIELPNPLLETGLVIVDTPGVGGLFRAHRDITWRFAPNADGIIFVLDSVEAVISADEISFLRELTSKYTKRLIFIQTKIDKASEELWKGWQTRNKQILESKLGLNRGELFYFPLSSKLKHDADRMSNLKILDRAGYLPLIHFLQGKVIPAKESEIARQVAKRLNAITLKLRNEITSQLRVARDSTANELVQLASDRRQAVADFQCWEKNIFQPALSVALSSLNRSKRIALDEIDEALNPNGQSLLDYVDHVKTLIGTEILEQASVIQQDFMERCGFALKAIFDNFLSQYSERCEAVSAEFQVTRESQNIALALTPIEGVGFRTVDSLDVVPMTSFDQLRTSFLGGSATAALASVAVSVAAVAFPPLAGLTAIAAFGAGLWGGGKAMNTARNQEKLQIVNSLRTALGQQLSQIRRPIIRQFDDKAEECSAALQTIFSSAKAQIEMDLERRLSEATEAGTRSKDEAKKVVEKLEAKLKVIDSAVKKLEPITDLQRG